MTIQLLKKSALHLFLEKGYEGASLADIAEAVGIKKQSIYAHFKSKDDLFLTIVNDVVNEEIGFLNEFFNTQDCELEDYLKNFICKFKERYIEHEDGNIKFILRMSFMPPYHLKTEALEKFDLYYYEIEGLVTKVFLNSEKFKAKTEKGTFAFMTMLDGLWVALLYGSEERFNKKFSAAWNIYLNGLLS
ncbi:transcriptional regulator, TetR family [Clostridium cavendishii DSM 21758]|uniref:Transcriptional regulator, TetR family n=1 Tax=Clostridium cavendishii DSM 21758 TaxID=1121302 RepID=A0A1M6VSJ2_9CLOT|nr:TetR/AcrR family transcriptional regulator [Clostridium cavendishii]SHK84399.1 transcriptional regulator, TetR family [Clostridium cavendishii DSM 21758]